MTSAREVARFLDAAQRLGIRIGTDGAEVVLLAPLKVPGPILRAFEEAIDKNSLEFIRQILADVEARRLAAPVRGHA
jgi:hypothetical protein